MTSEDVSAKPAMPCPDVESQLYSTYSTTEFLGAHHPLTRRSSGSSLSVNNSKNGSVNAKSPSTQYRPSSTPTGTYTASNYSNAFGRTCVKTYISLSVLFFCDPPTHCCALLFPLAGSVSPVRALKKNTPPVSFFLTAATD